MAARSTHTVAVGGARDQDWFTAGEALARLGVKPQTLYAYVSRGLVRSERVTGTRTSRYRRADVERLASRTRGTPVGTGPEIVVDSALTLLDPVGRFAYRGWDVTQAAEEASYEIVAEWLWGTDPGPDQPWTAPRDAVKVARRAQAALPAGATIPDLLRVAAAAVASCDPLRNDRRRAAVAARARALIATLVESLPLVGSAARAPAGAPIADRLWPRLSPLPATPPRVAALDHALVLLADHELAASTLAARVAASAWADPYLVVSAGLAAAGGPLHAGASEAVRHLLHEIAGGTPAAIAVGQRLRDLGAVPGFGHKVYEGPDPRAAALLAAVRRARPPRDVMRAAADVEAIVAEDGEEYPNIDFALGAFTEAASMVPGAGEAIFVLARCAGWIAHGLEEYEHRLRYRIRAAYTGPDPDWA
jgi:citrate synthase